MCEVDNGSKFAVDLLLPDTGIQIKSQLEAIDSHTTFQRVHKSPNFTGVNCALDSQLPGTVSATF